MRTLLIGINVLLAASFAIWPAIFFLSFFLTGAPGAFRDPLNVLLLASIWVYPAVVLAGNILFWSILPGGSSKEQLRWTLVGCLGPVMVLVIGAQGFSRGPLI